MVENNMYNVEDFYKNGYFIVDDFLEEFYHKKLLNRFKEESEWTRIDQVRDHYKKGGPFEMNSKHFPNRDETYYLQGWRAKKLEEDAAWRKDYHDIFLSKISKLFKNEIKCKKFDFKCKSQKFLDETKEYQKKKISDGQKQLNQTKEKLNEAKDEAIKRIPKIK